MSDEDRFRERRSAHAEVDETPSSPPEAEGDPELGEERLKEEGREAVSDEPGGEPAATPEEAPDLEALAEMDIPDASFLELVQPLEVQALQFLGEIPLTRDGQKAVLPKWAKHVIDLLGILEERTRGNLTDDEARYLEQVLTALRTRYLAVRE